MGAIPSCLPAKGDPLSYKASGFVAEITFSGGDKDIKAVFYVSAPDENGSRSYKAELTAPDSLKGLTISQSGDELKLFLDGNEYASVSPSLFNDSFLHNAAKLLLPEGAIRSIMSLRGAECGLPHIETLTAVTAGDTVVYIDPATDLPVKMTHLKSGICAMIHSITPSEQTT